jgi:X-X-X-Leu-X-X-Gly heptad repeat protein
MPWQTTNLAESMGGIASKANEAISQVQSGLNKLNNQVNQIRDNMTRAASIVSSSKGTLDKLMDSGFYMITLSPKKGSWSSRLSSAPNAPPNLNYCCGTAVITVAPDLSTVTRSYQGILDAVKKPMADASNIVNPFDFSDFEPEEEPEDLSEIDEESIAAIDWSELFTTDEWKTASLKDVFGGYAEGVAKATNKLSKSTKSLLATVNQSGRAASAINKGLSATKNMVKQMQETGVYRIVLAPGEGTYLHRLRNETGAPSSSSQLFTSGYVCVTVAPSLSALTSKYETLSKIVTGG